MNEWPKAVTTSSIWIAVGVSLGFGLFKMKFSGDAAAVLFLPIILTVMIIGGATIATKIVWQSQQPNNNDVNVEK